jgi:glycosyltransferase involved in cell wall biosynthesis
MDSIEVRNISKTDSKRDSVVAIIPAHNEAARIGHVLEVLKKVPLVDRIVVVDDGSQDNTSETAKKYGVEVIRFDVNRGKASAMDEGVQRSSEPIILFVDADLQNLSVKPVNDLIQPVLNGEAEMTMGIFRKGRFRTDIAHFISPGLSGQRAIKRHVWGLLDNSRPMDSIGYGIEEELQSLVKEGKVTLKIVHWEGVSQFTKEEKLGPQEGFKLRMRMYHDIIRTWTKRLYN